MAKKIIWAIVLAIVIVPLLFLGWMGFRYLQNNDPDKSFFTPELKFAHLVIYEWNSQEMKMNAELTMKNKLPFRFKADSVEFTLTVSGVEVARNIKKLSINLAPDDSSSFDLPVVIKLAELQKLEKESADKQDSVPYRLEATFYSKILTTKKRKYVKEKMLPLFHLLDIKIGHLKLGTLKRHDTNVDLSLTIHNKNVFPVQIKNLDYDLYLDEKFIGKGNIPRKITFGAGKTAHIQFPLKVSYDNLWDTVKTLLKQKKKTGFHLKVSFDLMQGKHFSKSSRIVVDRKGKLDEVFSDED